jgi:hypothetical protein
MGDRAGSGPLRRLLPWALIGAVAFTGGCFPQGDNDGGDNKLSFAGADSIVSNRSGKGDPLDTVAAVTRNLFETTSSSTSPREEATKTARPDERDSGSQPSLAAAPASALPAEIDDTAAGVALANFFRALGALESGRVENAVTILHLGDSHISADRFSGDMREQFQSRFGNAGRGMLMPGMYMARGVKFDQAGSWQTALSTGNAPGPYGLTGVKVTAQAREDWLRVTATDQPFGWAELTWQTGPGQGSAIVALDGDAKQMSLGGQGQNWKTVRLERQARELIIRPKGDGPITLHSIFIGHDKPGVRYINLGLPGATALTPLSWHAGQIAHDLQRVAANLIILGYGTEESFDDGLDPRDYENRVTAMLGALRRAAPDASILVIGPPDIARLPKFAGVSRSSDVCRALSPQERGSYAQRIRAGDQRLARWHPPLRLDDVRLALRRAAAANRAYFWDWSKLMGGTCGVHAWVHSEPPLAAGDHIHLTEEGSKRSARLLFRELMNGYDAYDRAVAVGEGGWKPATSQPAPVTAAAPARKAK